MSNFTVNQGSGIPQANNGGEVKQRTNFKLGMIWAADSQVDITMWKSQLGSSIYSALRIRQLIGKDPQGRSTFEQSPGKDAVCANFRPGEAKSFLMQCRDVPAENVSVDMKLGKNQDTHIVVKGSPMNVTITITNKNGTRTATIPTTPVDNGKNQNGDWDNLLDIFAFSIRSAILAKANVELIASEEEPF